MVEPRLSHGQADQDDAARLLGEMWSPDRVAHLMGYDVSALEKLLQHPRRTRTALLSALTGRGEGWCRSA